MRLASKNPVKPKVEEEKPPIDGRPIPGAKFVEMVTFKPKVASSASLFSLNRDGVPQRKIWDAHARIGAINSTVGFTTFKLTTQGLPTIEDKKANDKLGLKTADFASTIGSSTGFGQAQMASTMSPHGSMGRSSTMLRGESSMMLGEQSSMTFGDRTSLASDSVSPSGTMGSGFGLTVQPKPMKRADKYFQLLMKAHNAREKEWAKAEEEEEWARCEGAALGAYQAQVAAETHFARGPIGRAESVESDGSDSDSEKEDKEEDDDYGVLTEFDGQMKIDLELIVLRAPGCEDYEDDKPEDSDLSSDEEADEEAAAEREAEAAAEDSDSDSDSEAKSEAKSEEPGEAAPDLSDELEALKAEMKAVTQEPTDEEKAAAEEAAAAAAAAPNFLRGGVKRMPNMWDNPNPNWSLDLGGSIFFLPDAERYAHMPSLPPPPPPSVQGRRRMRLKPRLPLEVSNGRYPDERPNIWPAAPYSPPEDKYRSFEEKMMTYDLYRSCSDGLLTLKPQTRAKQGARQQFEFGSFIEKQLTKSQSWKNWRVRAGQKAEQEQKRQEEEEQKAALALAAKNAAEAAKKERELEEED